MPDECIHGLGVGLCDSCYPKAPPPEPVRTSTPRTQPRPAPARVQTTGDRRVYLVVSLDELEASIEAGLIEGETRWHTEAAAWSRDDVVLATSVDALGEGTVFVEGDAVPAGEVPLACVQVVGVANEPARARVRAVFSGLDRPPRVVVHPPWFAPA